MTSAAKQSIARAVIASEAKQSISPRKGRMDCFAALAMTSKHTFATSPRHAPEALIKLLYLGPASFSWNVSSLEQRVSLRRGMIA